VRKPLVLVVLLIGCNTKHPDAPSPSASAGEGGTAAGGDASETAVVDAATEAAAPNTIGEAGGVVEENGVRITIPAGAVRTAYRYTITKVTGDELKEWPRGTEEGIVFEPAGKRFRIPATIELLGSKDDKAGGEVMCIPYNGDRMIFSFDPDMAVRPYRFHVAELPRRCAVYSAEHAKALKSARVKESEVVEKNNKSHKWEMKGKVCDPHQLVRPNAGKDLREPPGVGGCPNGMAPIPGRPNVCVDRWEAHVVEVLDDGTEHTWSPYFNSGSLRIRAKSAPNAVPQGYLSQVQAGAACKEAGKRLCKDDEWVAACKGSKGTQFPYGKDEKRGTCNDQRDKHPAMQYLESADLSVFTKLEHPCISQVPDSLLPTGTKKQCVNAEGIYDIVGNLHEWTADPAGTFRGGYYVDTWLNGHGCDYVTTRHDASYWDYSIGFRCCADKRVQ
jgi:formylglycine-generating enzyme